MTYEAWNCGRWPEGARLVATSSTSCVEDDANQIKNLLASAIQRSGAGRLAEALVKVGALDELQTIADYVLDSPPPSI